LTPADADHRAIRMPTSAPNRRPECEVSTIAPSCDDTRLRTSTGAAARASSMLPSISAGSATRP
jgi:hypothetical protein